MSLPGADAARLVRGLTAAALAASLLLTGGLGGAPGQGSGGWLGGGVPDALAATPDLTLVSDATYVVEPAAKTVSVTASITARNNLHDTLTKRYYFTTGYLAVLPNTSNFRLTTPGGHASVSVARRTATYTLLKLGFGSQLAAGASKRLTLTFDLKDPGGAPDRPIRISPSLVSFYAWAFASASTPGSTVTVTFPAGYNVTIGRGPLTGPTANPDGSQSWTSGPLDAPLSFVADVTADHPSDYVDVDRTVAIGDQQANLVLRSWPDDPAWRTRVGDLVATGLPVLSQDIGLGWPAAQDPLVIQEALVRSTGGYAGLFDPSQHRVEIAYAAPPSVILHEAAHAWFNGALVADRWAAEAFASYYAEVAGAALKVTVASPTLDDPKRAAAIPLNAWGSIGTEQPATEAYAYAASLVLARSIADRAGADGLRRVWAMASAGIGAYQPPGSATAAGSGIATAAGSAPTTPEAAAGPPDWRGLLDLLEDATGRSYVDLWRTWVVRPEDLPALDARGEARAAYDTAIADAGAWQLPKSIRDAMRAWQFDIAGQQLNEVESILRQRAALQREAASASLDLPAALETAFESGDLTGAAAEAAAELATIGAIGDATAARPASVTFLESIGLLGASPDDELQTARTAFAAGDLDGASRAAAAAKGDWLSAAAVGRGRVISAIGLVVALILLAVIVTGQARRARARATATATPGTSTATPGPTPVTPGPAGPGDDDDPLHSRP